MIVLRLFEQQLQAWRLSVQSEQSILENRCSGVEGTLEVLRRETSSLEGLLTQVTFDLLHHLPSSSRNWEGRGIIGVGVQCATVF